MRGSIVAMLTMLIFVFSKDGHALVWRRALVSLTRLLRSDLHETYALPRSLLVPRYAICAPMCNRKSWCKVWCLSSRDCILSDVTLLEGHVEAVRTDTVPCYTTRGPDLATGASITGSPDSGPDRWKTNLVDGFYSTYSRECFVGALGLFPYVVVDFGSLKTLRRVTLIMETSSNAIFQKNYEVRVGTTAVDPAQLNTYQLFGSFPGPATSGQVVVIEAPQPVAARYLSIQMMEYQFFVFCHLEIE